MALESSDLNDGQILQQTRQITDERGHVQFAFKLPSGRDLKSEFMRKEDARTGIKKWLEVVKEQAIADSNAERLERAAKSRRGAMDLERKPGDDQPLFRAGGARGPIAEDGTVLPVPAKTPAVVPTETNSPKQDYPSFIPDPDLNGEVEPTSFAEKQLAYYDMQVRQYQPLLEKAVRRRHQWQTVITALEES